MKRKQRKSLPWRSFGYMILIIIKFSDFCFDFLRELLMICETISNTSKLLKKLGCASFFFNPLHLVKHSSYPLIYYFTITSDKTYGRWSVLLTLLPKETKLRTPTQAKKESKTNRKIRQTTTSKTNPKPSIKTSCLRSDLVGHLVTSISILNMRLITCTSVHKWSENQSFSLFPQQIQPPSLTRKLLRLLFQTYIYILIFSLVSENNRRLHSNETGFNKVHRKWVKRLAMKVPVVACAWKVW